jgi:hypothetical protein
MKININVFIIILGIVSLPLPVTVFAQLPGNHAVTLAETAPAVGTEAPEQNFKAANKDFIEKDYKAAATEIRKSTEYLHHEAERASGDVKQALNESTRDLDKLADEIENKTVKDEKSLHVEFSRANYALALDHHLKAYDAWGRKEYTNVGYEIKAAAGSIKNSAMWADRRLDEDASGSVSSSIAMGNKIISGAADWTRDQVSDVFRGLGSALDDLGKKIGSKRHHTSVNIRRAHGERSEVREAPPSRRAGRFVVVRSVSAGGDKM